MTSPDRYPIVVRYLAAGAIGFVISLVLYEAVFFANPLDDLRAPSSWTVSYMLGVVIQHGLHRRITFVGTVAGYGRSLRRSYVVYTVVLAVTTFVDWIATDGFGWNHRIVWLGVVILASVLSFFGLRWFAFAEDDPHAATV